MDNDEHTMNVPVMEPAGNNAGEVEGQTVVGRKGEDPITVCIPKRTNQF
jgi:hypothetical protein